MKTLVWTRKQDLYEQRLKAMKLPGCELLVPKSEEELRRMIPQAEVILANPMVAPFLEGADNLKWCQSVFAGVDAFVAAEKRGYLLTNVKDTYGKVMGEYVLAYILMFEKEILNTLADQKKREWNNRPFESVAERTVGILGTGSIGKEIAAACAALGMKVLGYRSVEEPMEGFERVYGPDNFKQFLTGCDYVLSVLPHTEKTEGLFDAEAFRAMKGNAVFINVGRGSVLVEEDLLAALDGGELRAAVLDVFRSEPLPKEHPFWGHEKVFVTPHVSGFTINDRIFEIFEENWRRFQAGEELEYLVDLGRGY